MNVKTVATKPPPSSVTVRSMVPLPGRLRLIRLCRSCLIHLAAVPHPVVVPSHHPVLLLERQIVRKLLHLVPRLPQADHGHAGQGSEGEQQHAQAQAVHARGADVLVDHLGVGGVDVLAVHHAEDGVDAPVQRLQASLGVLGRVHHLRYGVLALLTGLLYVGGYGRFDDVYEILGRVYRVRHLAVKII
mmetsp:Transcript_15146/g.33873  ORF Transcript_15146/g.33873 Transcript_15146/m.33873 type:complete len:188 (-) Transcript_15146:1352-1915(-)